MFVFLFCYRVVFNFISIYVLLILFNPIFYCIPHWIIQTIYLKHSKGISCLIFRKLTEAKNLVLMFSKDMYVSVLNHTFGQEKPVKQQHWKHVFFFLSCLQNYFFSFILKPGLNHLKSTIFCKKTKFNLPVLESVPL